MCVWHFTSTPSSQFHRYWHSLPANHKENFFFFNNNYECVWDHSTDTELTACTLDTLISKRQSSVTAKKYINIVQYVCWPYKFSHHADKLNLSVMQATGISYRLSGWWSILLIRFPRMAHFPVQTLYKSCVCVLQLATYAHHAYICLRGVCMVGVGARGPVIWDDDLETDWLHPQTAPWWIKFTSISLQLYSNLRKSSSRIGEYGTSRQAGLRSHHLCLQSERDML